MGNAESSRRSDQGSRKGGAVPKTPHVPAIQVIRAPPPPAHLPGPAQTGSEDAGNHMEVRDLSGDSRRHFIRVTTSRSPEVRRSRDPDCLRDQDAGESASLEDERAAAALDPAEHEWMMRASDGEWRSLQRLLEGDPGLVLKRDFVTGFTCLHWAAKHGNPELIATIVNFARQHDVPVDVDARSSMGYTPLHVAAMHRNVEVVKLLVGAYGTDVEVRDFSGRRACQYLQDGVGGDIRDIAGACQAPDPPLEAAQDEPPLRRTASFSRLQKLRRRTSQLFHGRDDLEASRKASFRIRPKTHFFG